MIFLPYISDSGPRNSGPTAYANTKVDSISSKSTSSVILNSTAMLSNAGATMEDETGDMKVKNDTRTAASLFFFVGQFLGLSGSSGPFHVTWACQYSRGLIDNQEGLTSVTSLFSISLVGPSPYECLGAASKSRFGSCVAPFAGSSPSFAFIAGWLLKLVLERALSGPVASPLSCGAEYGGEDIPGRWSVSWYNGGTFK